VQHPSPYYDLSPEQGFELNEKLLSKLHAIYKATLAMNVLKWIMMVLGVSLGAGSLWLMKKQSDVQSLDFPGITRKVQDVTPPEDRLRY
jgi:hypothetical protein